MGAALWQVQDSAADGKEATAGAANTILFNTGTVGGTGTYIYRVEVLGRNSSPENTAVEGGTNDIEDMGADGLDIQVAGAMKNAIADVKNLYRFWLEAKTATGYIKGRFGFRFDDLDFFGVVPTSTYGYHVINPRVIFDYEHGKVVAQFIFTLRLSGDVPSAIKFS